MKFLKALKRGFGFGSNEDEPDELLSDSPQTEPSVTPSDADLKQAIDNTQLFSDEMKQHIFDKVLDVFNMAQPDFIRRSLNTDEQRKFLYDQLDVSIKDYISQIALSTQTQCEDRYRNEQSDMRLEMSKLQENAKQLERQREELKQQHLSTERQKRALSDRINDLEKQLADMEAEREQNDLVTRGLINKLKVAGVQSGNESFAIDSEQLAEETKAADAELEKLRAENKELNEALDVLKDKQRISDEMVNDMRRRAAEARQALEASQKEVEEYRVLDAEMERLNEQMTKVEEVLSKRDEKIAKLTEENNRLTKSETELSEKVKSLQNTIVENLHKQAEVEKTLREQIADLERRPTVPPTTILFDEKEDAARLERERIENEKLQSRQAKKTVKRPIHAEQPKISDSDLAAIDENFTTKMSSEKPAGKASEAKESDFGYHAPRRQQYQDSDAQMSLPFDV